MANCPKCQKKLKIWHISQYCPYCGSNIVFNSFEAQFEKDRRIAEMSMANFRIKLEKVKKAFISGTPQKLKIVACILPLAGLFVPFGSVCISSALYEKKFTFWFLDMVFNGFMGEGYFNKLATFTSAPVFGDTLSALRTAMIFFAVTAIAAIGVFLSELLCFTGNKRSGFSIAVFSCVGAVGTLAARICSGSVVSTASAAGDIFVAKANILFIIPFLFFVFAAFAAVLSLKNPPVYVFKEGDELRIEYRKKLKSGEIKLMDIPAPISESEDEKAEREKLIRGAYHMEEVESNG